MSLDENDDVGLFGHSGSRGIGNRIAQHHIKAAQTYCREHDLRIPHPDLAYLVEGTGQFDRYLREIPRAHKDIDVVIEDARDLVGIRHTLRQIVNVKGN